MNAVIALCHFCETHGPCVVLFTSTESSDNICSEEFEDDIKKDGACNACAGPLVQLKSTDREGHTYKSRHPNFTNNSNHLLRQACIRSLSCEVSTGQENSTVFFGDNTHGYVLSYMFQIKDTQARGLKKWFSFIILMKDKMYLLNITPFLTQQMEEIAKELQSLADNVFAKDQAKCSQRVLRLKNYKPYNDAPRSLIEMTGKEHVFGYLHVKFSLLLSSSGKLFSEVVCNGISPFRKDVNLDLNSKMSIYDVQKYFMKDDFLKIVYCILTGVQIIIRGDSDICSDIVNSLLIFLPKNPNHLEYTDYIPSSEARIFYCKSNVAVPKPCSAILRIDIVEEKPIIHWPGSVSKKWPTLMLKIMKAVDNELNESVILNHITALKDEWLNYASVIKSLKNAKCTDDSILQAKKTMGIKVEDEDLLNYWIL